MKLKKYLPYIGGALAATLILYIMKPGFLQTAKDLVERVQVAMPGPVEAAPAVIISEYIEPRACPEIKPKVCPKQKKCRAVYKEKIVHVPVYIKPKPGCHINWETGQVSGVTTAGNNLKCTVDYQRRDIKAYYWRDDRLKRNPPGLLPDPVIRRQ